MSISNEVLINPSINLAIRSEKKPTLRKAFASAEFPKEKKWHQHPNNQKRKNKAQSQPFLPPGMCATVLPCNFANRPLPLYTRTFPLFYHPQFHSFSPFSFLSSLPLNKTWTHIKFFTNTPFVNAPKVLLLLFHPFILQIRQPCKWIILLFPL